MQSVLIVSVKHTYFHIVTTIFQIGDFFFKRSSRWQRSVESLLHFLLLRTHLVNSYFTGSVQLKKNTDIS